MPVLCASSDFLHGMVAALDYVSVSDLGGNRYTVHACGSYVLEDVNPGEAYAFLLGVAYARKALLEYRK